MCQFCHRLRLLLLLLLLLSTFCRHWQFVYYFTGKNTGKLWLMPCLSLPSLSRSLPLGWMSCKLSFRIRGFQNAFNNAWPHSVWVNPRDKHARSSSVQGRVCVCVCVGERRERGRGRDRQIVSQLDCVCVGDSFGILPTYNGSGNTTYTTLAASAQSRFYCLTIMYIWLPC